MLTVRLPPLQTAGLGGEGGSGEPPLEARWFGGEWLLGEVVWEGLFGKTQEQEATTRGSKSRKRP